jgi:hypothetical protein
MAGDIRYLNTDLDLVSPDDLTPLTATFTLSGVFPLHVTHSADGLWHSALEVHGQHTEPEPDIGAMVSVVESLDEPLRSLWLRCTQREFNVGYDCGSKPWAFNQGLSTGLLRRVAAVGASLRITLYPPRAPRRKQRKPRSP